MKTADETAAPVVFHVDVNSAFLSWEAVYRIRELGAKKDLRDELCAVGGDRQARRGIILAQVPVCEGIRSPHRRVYSGGKEKVSGS